MPVPKQKQTKSRTGRRRSHHALKKRFFAYCAKCGSPILPHRVCPECGAYAGRTVIDVFAKLDKRERKKKEKEIAAVEEKKVKEKGRELSLEELSKK